MKYLQFLAFANRLEALRFALLVVFGVGVLTASAHAKFYLGPVPSTLQTYVLFVLAFAMAPRAAIASVLAYLALAAAGAPVLANGSLLSPSGGYALGFLPAVCILAAAARVRTFARFFAAGLLATAAIYACGLAQLALFVPAEKLFELGVKPFILTDLLKATVAALSMLPARKFFDKFSH